MAIFPFRMLASHKKLIGLIFLLLVCVLVLQLYIGSASLTSADPRIQFGRLKKRMQRSGLVAEGEHFKLDDKQITILSGAIHYFRVVPEYWEDRLLKLKALGFNTVETYVAWNLHEPAPGVFNFEGIADIRKYIKLAQKLGLHVIVRPGPYICAEWEFGGLPSWLLRNRELIIRSFSRPYLVAVERYFSKLFKLLVPLQYQAGGPIIAFQIENEYGQYGDSSQYMKHLYNVFIKNGISELLFTSDGISGIKKRLLPPVLQTVNFQFHPEDRLKELKQLQPDKPLMVMEYWPGWFDHWGEKHHVIPADETVKTVRAILSAGSSINFYMFHGGTNFGFMNGGNNEGFYQPTITSYDYDCPISESGDITEKYLKIHKLLKELNPTNKIPDVLRVPPKIEKTSYGSVKLTKSISLEAMVELQKTQVSSEDVMAMEDLPINNGAGQSYGYTLYRTEIPNSAEELAIEGLRDYGQVFIDQQARGVAKWPIKNVTFKIQSTTKSVERRNLDILVENCGRVNYGNHLADQRKGIHGQVEIDKRPKKQWKIVSFDFSTDFMDRLLDSSAPWKDNTGSLTRSSLPSLFRGTFTIKGKPKDTFLDMKGWTKGVAFINGHNLGRYWNIGPQETLYVPAPWLTNGLNTVIIFEQHPSANNVVNLVENHRLGPRVERKP